jgi:tripartite-type tricarboxylate transporter receptor subunit TctC
MVTNLTKTGIVAAALMAGLLLAATGNPAGADSFYNDKTVRIIVGGTAGGGYDATARLVARHLPAQLGGGARAIVQNMPGAGTVKAPLYLYNVAPTDSTVIGALNNAVAFAPLLGVAQADFDPTKFNWLGSPSTETGLAVIWHAVPVNSIADATQREVIMATSGGGSSAAFYGRVLNTVLGTKFKLLSGYSGMGEAFLAMERGETEGFPSALWSSLQATKPEWIAEKKVKILLQYGRKPNPDLPDVPIARDLAKTEEDRMLIDAAMAPLEMGRPFAMAPQAPAEHVQVMRAAMMATFKDAGFIAEAKKQKFEIDAVPKTGDDLLAIVADVYNAPKQVRDRLVDFYKMDAN